MLKTCYPPKFDANKTCGEIICQTEASFFIVCKLCGIKIFEYNEFVNHFLDSHWPEAALSHTFQDAFNDDIAEQHEQESEDSGKDCLQDNPTVTYSEEMGNMESDESSTAISILKKVANVNTDSSI